LLQENKIRENKEEIKNKNKYIYFNIKTIMDSFAGVPNDIIIKIAFDMPLSDISSWSQTSRRFNDVIANNDNFWIQRLWRDYGIDYYDLRLANIEPKIFYILYTERDLNAYIVLFDNDLNSLVPENVIDNVINRIRDRLDNMMTGELQMDIMILNNLNDRELVSAGFISPNIGRILQNDIFWFRRILQKYPNMDMDILRDNRRNRTWYEYYFQDFSD
jgi:hypothetical protein